MILSAHPRIVAVASIVVFCVLLLQPVGAKAQQASLNADQQLAHDILRQLIEINTSHSVGSVTTASLAMKARLLAAGFPEQDLLLVGSSDRKQNLILRVRGTQSAGAILFFCHLDVVEARRSDWSTDPFQFVEKDGYYYGRGTQDIKEADAILIANFIRLHQQGFHPAHDLLLMLTADEEAGPADGMDWLLQHRPDLFHDVLFAVNPDAGDVNLEDGKVVSVDYEATEKTYADFELTADDPGGHSSLPHAGNPIQRLIDGLARLGADPFPLEMNPVVRESFRQEAAGSASPAKKALIEAAIAPNAPASAWKALAAGSPFANAQLRTTCIPTRFEGGHANNALPQSATANLNCRILPGHSPAEVEERIERTLADPAIHVRYLSSQGFADRAPSFKGVAAVVPQPEILAALQNTVHRQWPGVPVFGEMETGASDSIYTMQAGIRTYGITAVGIDENDVRAHGKDERIRVSAFYQGLEFFYQLLQNLDQINMPHVR